MAKREMAQYRIDCDEPGMQITGAGSYLGGDSVVKPGTILSLPVGALEGHGGVRACMTPLNDAAKAEFAAKRKKVEREWRESLPKGQSPDGQELEVLGGRTLSPAEVESWVKRAVAKVGPTMRTLQRSVKKKNRPTFNPGVMQAAPVASPAVVDDEIAEPTSGVRASDSI